MVNIDSVNGCVEYMSGMCFKMDDLYKQLLVFATYSQYLYWSTA